MVEGKIETVTVSTFAEQSLSELSYSYVIDGERYSGYFTRQFADEKDAWDYVRPLKGQPIFVRHKPSNPAVFKRPHCRSEPSGRGWTRELGCALHRAFGLAPDWRRSKGKLEFGSITKTRTLHSHFVVSVSDIPMLRQLSNRLDCCS